VGGHARHLLWLPATAAVLLLACFSDQSLDHGSPLWHAAAFLSVLSGVGAGNRLLSWRPLAFIGVASYSIYLVHGPTMTFLIHDGIQQFVAAIISVLGGILFWLCVERTALAARGRSKNAAVATARATSATNVELHASA
jgi:peptidoglycan/LPS O-acetylase OafA/YrhL